LQFLWLLDREATVWNTPDGCQASQVAKATIAASSVVIIFAISKPVVMLTLVMQFCSFNLTVVIMLPKEPREVKLLPQSLPFLPIKMV